MPPSFDKTSVSPNSSEFGTEPIPTTTKRAANQTCLAWENVKHEERVTPSAVPQGRPRSRLTFRNSIGAVVASKRNSGCTTNRASRREDKPVLRGGGLVLETLFDEVLNATARTSFFKYRIIN